MKTKKKMPNTVRIIDEELMKWIKEHSKSTGLKIFKIVEFALRSYRASKNFLV